LREPGRRTARRRAVVVAIGASRGRVVGHDSMKRNILIAVILTFAAMVAAILASVFVLELFEPSFYYAWKQERMVRRVLAANPDHVRSAARQLLQSRPGFVGDINPSASGVPSAIRRLRPTRISFETHSVSVDFSDVFNPFGITVYAAGVSPPDAPTYGRGPAKWIEGLWVYDDGQLEKYGRQVGPANVSQPIRAQ